MKHELQFYNCFLHGFAFAQMYWYIFLTSTICI
jgi:hypothetical protein